MEDKTTIPLTASEISNLWANYLDDSMVTIGFRYFLNHCDDQEVREILDTALEYSQQHIYKLTNLFQRENFPIPRGFTDQDVNVNAPRLFSDVLYLHYLVHMCQYSMTVYSLALSTAARPDIISYFSECLHQAIQLHNKAKALMQSKGLFERDPIIPIPDTIDFVKKQNFIAGWFGDKRPISGVEVSNLFLNMKLCELGKAITNAFNQVADSKEVKKYMERGRDIATKHIDIFSALLKEGELPSPSSLVDHITNSTESPFSDKLLLFHLNLLVTSGVGQYGTSLSFSPRHDIGAHYTRLIGELLHYSEDGLNIMIDNGWLEQLPLASNRKN